MKPLKLKFPKLRIESERIYLQKLEMKLADFMFTYVDNDRKRLRKFLPWVDRVKTVEDEKNFIKITQKGWKKYNLFGFGIFLKTDDTYIGNIDVHSIRWDCHSCEFGYWILGDFEGHGYMSEAVKALESEMFKLGFNRVQIRCNDANKRSANVPRACGYKLEGIIRQDGIELGKFRDTMIFGKLKKEWKNKSKK